MGPVLRPRVTLAICVSSYGQSVQFSEKQAINSDSWESYGNHLFLQNIFIMQCLCFRIWRDF